MRRYVLGISGRTRPVNRKLQHSLHLKHPSLVEVVETGSASPAAQAGVKQGDLLVRVDGKGCESMDGQYRILGGKGSREPFVVELMHDGQRKELRVLARRP